MDKNFQSWDVSTLCVLVFELLKIPPCLWKQWCLETKHEWNYRSGILTAGLNTLEKMTKNNLILGVLYVDFTVIQGQMIKVKKWKSQKFNGKWKKHRWQDADIYVFNWMKNSQVVKYNINTNSSTKALKW